PCPDWPWLTVRAGDPVGAGLPPGPREGPLSYTARAGRPRAGGHPGAPILPEPGRRPAAVSAPPPPRSMKPTRKISGASLRHAFEEIIWPRRKLILVGLVLILVNRLSGLVLPASTRYLVDDVLGGGNGDLLYRLLGLVGIAIALQSITSYALTMLLSVEAQNLIANLRAQVQQHVLRLPVRVFDNTKSGELVSRIMDDVEGVRNLVGTGLVQLVGGTVTAVVALVFL